MRVSKWKMRNGKWMLLTREFKSGNSLTPRTIRLCVGPLPGGGGNGNGSFSIVHFPVYNFNLTARNAGIKMENEKWKMDVIDARIQVRKFPHPAHDRAVRRPSPGGRGERQRLIFHCPFSSLQF